MINKFTIITLATLIAGIQANGASYLKRFWAPSAIAAASALAGKATLCEETSQKKFQLSRDYSFNGKQVVDVLKKCQVPVDICKDESGGFSDCDLQVGANGYVGTRGPVLVSSLGGRLHTNNLPNAFNKFFEVSTEDKLKMVAGENCVIHGLFDGYFSTADSAKIIAFRKAFLLEDSEDIMKRDLEEIKSSNTQDGIATIIAEKVQLGSAVNYHKLGNKSFEHDGNFLKCILGYAKESNRFDIGSLEKCKQAHPIISDYAIKAATLAVERSVELNINEIRARIKQIKFIKQMGASWFGSAEQMNDHLLVQINEITKILDRHSIKHPARKTNGWLEDLEGNLPTIFHDKNASIGKSSISRE